jgi:hypothetical protein
VQVHLRSELLEREHDIINKKIHLFSMPHASLSTVRQSLSLLYFAQKTAIETVVSTLHDQVLLLLPQAVHRNASGNLQIIGDHASNWIPTILRAEVENYRTKRPIAQLATVVHDSGTSSGDPLDATAFPALPAAPKSTDIWHLATRSAPQLLPPSPQHITLPIPFFAQSVSLLAIDQANNTAFHNRTTLTGPPYPQIPDNFLQVQDSVAYDETLIITRFIWVLGLHPCQSLPNEELNRLTTLGEHRHVVRMLGTLSEYPQCAQQLTYFNGLSLDSEFSDKNQWVNLIEY